MTAVGFAKDDTPIAVLLLCDGAYPGRYIRCKTTVDFQGISTADEAREKASEQGWITEGNHDRCPECPEWHPAAWEDDFLEQQHQWIEDAVRASEED